MKSLDTIKSAIKKLGMGLGPDVLSQVQAIYDDEQRDLAARIAPAACDIQYGDHVRQVLDIYIPQNPSEKYLPVVLFVHGGGFLKGDKGDGERWFNSAVGRMVADAGMIGVVINYRLAPEYMWPSGGEDVGLAVNWIHEHIAEHGGSPEKIFALGTSAGSVHIATFLKLQGESPKVKGVILLSGLYGFTDLDERDTLYYGDPALYPERSPKEALLNTRLPLMIACAEFDPKRFQQEFVGLLQSRIQIHGVMPRSVILSGHNHYSMAAHLGTSELRLKNEILEFISEYAS